MQTFAHWLKPKPLVFLSYGGFCWSSCSTLRSVFISFSVRCAVLRYTVTSLDVILTHSDTIGVARFFLVHDTKTGK
jgi:hypothetical protein